MSYVIYNKMLTSIGSYYHQTCQDEHLSMVDVDKAKKFNCKSQAKRVAIQLGLSYDAVIEINDKGK